MPPTPPTPASIIFPTLVIALKSVAISHFFMSHIISLNQTSGPSMLPTLSVHNDWILVSALHRRGRGLRVGDVVALRHPVPRRGTTGAIKRIAGLGGDFVRVGDAGGGERMTQVPEGHCWLLGDNLPESRDSRAFGPVPLALVLGKVVARVWPLRDMKWIGNGLEKVFEDGDGDGYGDGDG